MTGQTAIRIEKSIAAISPRKLVAAFRRLKESRSASGRLPSLQSVPVTCLPVGAGGIRLGDAKTGWLGQHLLLEDDDGALIGAVPGYLKSHSQGEYVFDHGWADAFERAGGHYYPKLQCSVPFTPATGPRLLLPSGYDRAVRTDACGRLEEVTRQLGISSAHVTFVPKTKPPSKRPDTCTEPTSSSISSTTAMRP